MKDWCDDCSAAVLNQWGRTHSTACDRLWDRHRNVGWRTPPVGSPATSNMPPFARCDLPFVLTIGKGS